jgi:hypothetical protein
MTNQVAITRLSRRTFVRVVTAAALIIAAEIAGLDSFRPAIAQVTGSPTASVESDGFEGDPWEPV